jgi:RHS repeat-associated protein
MKVMRREQSWLNCLAKMAITCAYLLSYALLAQAQSQNTAPERGFHAGGSYALSEIETISRSSGELSLNLPLGVLPPGRGGLAAKLSLLYSSKLWDTFETVECSVHGTPGEASVLTQSQDGGWRYGYQYYLKLNYFKIPATEEFCNGKLPPDYCNSGITHPYQLVLVTPDGAQHKLWLDGHTDTEGFQNIWPDGTSACPGQTGETGTLTYYSTDSSFLRLDIAHDGDSDWTNNAWTLYLADGMRVLGGTIAGSNAFQRIIDRNGNYIEMRNVLMDPNYNHHETTYITDQLNRSVVLERNYTANQDAIHVTGVNGAEKLWLVEWRNIVVRKTYHRSDFNPSAGLNKTIRVVGKILLPTQAGNLFYTFDYNANATNNPSFGWGELSAVTLPSGASANYGYLSDGTNGGSIYSFHILRNRPAQKTLSYNAEYDGTITPITEAWTYGATFGDVSSTAVTETITTGPDGGVSKEYPNRGSNGGYFAGETNKTENPDGTVIERFYEANIPHGLPTFMMLANRFVKYEFVSIKNGQGNLSKTAIKEYSYDKNGNVTQVKEYDWVAYASVPRDVYGQPTGLPGGATPVRVTVNTFYSPTPDAANSTTFDADIYSKSTSPRLKNAIESSEVRTVSGTAASRTESFYDNATTTGNLTTAKSWDSTKGVISRPLTVSNSISVTNTYDAYGNLTLSTDGRGVQTKFTYGAVNGFTDLYPTRIEKAFNITSLRRTTHTEYDFYTGLATRVIDADNNVSTAMTYDVFGRPILVAAAEGRAEETHTTSEYSDIERRVITRSDQTTKDDHRLVTIRHYDQLGRLRLSRQLEDASVQSPYLETAGIKVQTRYRFSGANSYTLTSNPYRAATSGAATGETTMGWSRTKQDNGGRLAEVETFNGATLPAPWDSNTLSSGVVVTQYDANATTVIDQAGKTRRSITDGLGRLIEVVENPNGANYSTIYQYNTLDDLVRVQQGAQNRYFLYDSLKRLRRAFNPEQTANPAIALADPESGNNQWNMAYSYDNNSNLTQKVEARNITTNYLYDELNRVTERSYANDPQSTPMVTYRYDKDAQGNAIPFAKGRLTAVINSLSTTEYAQFDALGRIKQSKQTTNVLGTNYTFPISYDYDLAGALKSETYPSGRVINTTYDAAGRISEVTGVKSGQARVYASQFAYTAHGAVASMKVGNDPSNPRYEHTNFNSRLQPTQIGLGINANSTSLLGLDYSYGVVVSGILDPTKNNGNIESQTINVVSGTTLKQSYQYDALNRLTSVGEKVNTESTPRWTQSYTYDRFGNRTGLTNTGAEAGLLPTQSAPPVNPANNRLAGLDYDEAGNLLLNGNDVYVYDAENRLVSFQSSGSPATYAYDGDGRRVTRSIRGALQTWVTYVQVYDAMGRMIAEYSTQGTSISGQTSPKYMTTDHLGSTRLVTKADGSVKARYDYLPFGEELGAGIGTRSTAMLYSSTDATRQKFTGHERDGESGLDFMQARYCSSMSGRFISPDSVAGSPGNPQSLNLYAYVMNNPMKYTDPTGHAAENQQQQQSQQQIPSSIASFTLKLEITIPVITSNATEILFNPTLSPASGQVEVIPLPQIQGAVDEWLQIALPAYYQAELQNQKDATLGRQEVVEKQDKASKTIGGELSGQGKGGASIGTTTTGVLEQVIGLKASGSATGEQMEKTMIHTSRAANGLLIDALVPANDKLYQALGGVQINAPDGRGGHINRGLSDQEKVQAINYVNEQASSHVNKVVKQNIRPIKIPR